MKAALLPVVTDTGTQRFKPMGDFLLFGISVEITGSSARIKCKTCAHRIREATERMEDRQHMGITAGCFVSHYLGNYVSALIMRHCHGG